MLIYVLNAWKRQKNTKNQQSLWIKSSSSSKIFRMTKLKPKFVFWLTLVTEVNFKVLPGHIPAPFPALRLFKIKSDLLCLAHRWTSGLSVCCDVFPPCRFFFHVAVSCWNGSRPRFFVRRCCVRAQLNSEPGPSGPPVPPGSSAAPTEKPGCLRGAGGPGRSAGIVRTGDSFSD